MVELHFLHKTEAGTYSFITFTEGERDSFPSPLVKVKKRASAELVQFRMRNYWIKNIEMDLRQSFWTNCKCEESLRTILLCIF